MYQIWTLYEFHMYQILLYKINICAISKFNPYVITIVLFKLKLFLLNIIRNVLFKFDKEDV